MKIHCKRGHPLTLSGVKRPRCRVCANEYCKTYQRKHREEILAWRRQYYMDVVKPNAYAKAEAEERKRDSKTLQEGLRDAAQAKEILRHATNASYPASVVLRLLAG
jgi:hypothetical protein